ncbi:MAG: isochorismatase [bacterium]
MFGKSELPIPAHFKPSKVGKIWRVRYQKIAKEAEKWAKKYDIEPASEDKIRVCLVLIDVQNTFCIPNFELFVGGQSGNGAVEDNIRLCKFIYRNLGMITQIIATMDTHLAIQIFHPIFLVNDLGEHPAPATLISLDEIEKGIWKVNPAIERIVHKDYNLLQNYLLHYVRKLQESGKYELTIWPYHAMLGGIGHALVSSVEEACFFHSIARKSQTKFQIKGDNPLTENYSVLSPEVLSGPDNERIADKNIDLINMILDFDKIIIAGQAKSHCVAWTVDDLLNVIKAKDPNMASKVYLLEDCTSPVVIPGVVDFTMKADQAFKQFAQAGMNIVRSEIPIASWQ